MSKLKWNNGCNKIPPNMTALFCRCNLLIPESTCGTVCGSRRKERERRRRGKRRAHCISLQRCLPFSGFLFTCQRQLFNTLLFLPAWSPEQHSHFRVRRWYDLMMLPNPFICNILCDDISGNQCGPELIFRKMTSQHLTARHTDGLGITQTQARAGFAPRSQRAPSSEQVCHPPWPSRASTKPRKEALQQ